MSSITKNVQYVSKNSQKTESWSEYLHVSMCSIETAWGSGLKMALPGGVTSAQIAEQT